MNAKFEVIEMPATTLIGLNSDFYGGMSPKFNGQEVLGPLWGRVFTQLEDLGIAYQGRMIAATRPAASEEEGLLNQFVGQVVDELPSNLKGLEVFELPAMRLATYEHHGSMSGLVESIKKLYGEVLPASGLKQPHPWALELEIYEADFDPKKPDSVMLIATPVLAD
jgi:predicted transcriptional regulator YdeE